jgi:hypothetical protein
MSKSLFYKAIGLVVWKMTKFYVRQKLPARKVIVGATALGVGTLVAAGAKRANGD